MNTLPPVIELRAVKKAYGENPVLRGVDLAVGLGESVSLSGPNAAGKTTILQVIAGLCVPESGEVWSSGREITRLGIRARTGLVGLSMVLQSGGLSPECTAFENMALGLPTLGAFHPRRWAVGRREAKREVAELRERAVAFLAAFHLQDCLDRPAASLSYGQQKLVELGRVHVSGARVALLDEPFAGLGGRLLAESHRAVGEFRRAGTALVIVAHRLDSQINYLFDRHVEIRDGRTHPLPAET